jgi:hypothetical protein
MRSLLFQRLMRATILFASVAMLAGCALLPGKKLSVDLSALKECQRLGKRQPIPKIDEQSDYRDLSPEALAALKKANDGISARTKCEDSVIEKYAKQ